MAAAESAQMESISPASAPLQPEGDLTLEEIEETLNGLSLRNTAEPAAAAHCELGEEDHCGILQPAANTTGLEKSKHREREIHHLDASATTAQHGAVSQQRPDSRVVTGELSEQGLRANSPAEDRAHTIAAKRHPAPVDVEVFNLEEGPPSRSASPAVLTGAGAPRRRSSQGQLSSGDAEANDGAAANDGFTQQLRAGALKLKTSLFKPERISFSDVARNPMLAKRARAEMDNHQFKGLIEGSDGEVFEGRPHDLEVTRLQVALEVVESDADEESKINAQLAQLVCLRLDASRRAVERMLGVLQAVTAAEATYTRAMNAASRVKLVSECDGGSLRSAIVRFSDVPWFVAEAHAGVQNGLVEATRHCQDLVGELRKECQSISQESARARAAVLHARKSMQAAFAAHRSACRTADDVALERSRGGRPAPALKLELDPWLTESRVVGALRTLHEAQAHQRSHLATAYEQVRSTERNRCEVFREVANTFLGAYKNEFGPGHSEAEAIRGVVAGVDCDADLEQFSASAAAAVGTGRELAARQSAALESASQDLLCSPDIVRQGEMARWTSGAGRWADCHFILTRSGFLHWLPDPRGETTPAGSLNLGRCQFEAGDAPQFSLREHAGGLFGKGRRLGFKAPSVEDCCDWAIALRELIAANKLR